MIHVQISGSTKKKISEMGCSLSADSEMSIRKELRNIPYLNLNGEAQENSSISYLLADTGRTFSVAPGRRFKRLFFPVYGQIPHIETWGEREDRICWIGRPLPERIHLAKKINDMGIGLDIYSREPWPLSNWKGFAPDEIRDFPEV